MEKKKILWLSDHPLVPSGVGNQSKNLIEGLLKTGKYKFLCLGGAISHPDMRLQKIMPEKYGDDFLILPVNGYGDRNLMRQILLNERPDIIVFFTDPRFFIWLFEMMDEVKQVCPSVFYTIWDNDPTPTFNLPFYNSVDFLACISLKTYGIFQDLKFPKDRFGYYPHTVNSEVFKPLTEEENARFRKDTFGPHANKKFILFWNNRNARRKCTGDVITTFAKFSQKVGKENVALMMHTMVKDPEGQDVLAVARTFGVEQQMLISEQRVEADVLNRMYNATDCTINLASNEGWGLSATESLFSGSPIINHMTGGLQFQIGDWWEGRKDFSDQEEMTKFAKKMWKSQKGNWWGVPVFSASRSCTGSQQIPTIYDDRAAHEDVVDALVEVYEMGREKRKQLGLKAREWAKVKFNQEQMFKDWDEMLEREIEKFKNKQKDNDFRVVSI